MNDIVYLLDGFLSKYIVCGQPFRNCSKHKTFVKIELDTPQFSMNESYSFFDKFLL